MKGIILAGGSGSRLRPLTKVTSKQLLPIYNKPMIYYPLETLIQAGIKDILIIVAPDHAGDFLKLLGSGRDFDCKFTYEIQDKPEGLAQAFMIGKNFIGKDNVTLILGDNLYEDNFSQAIQSFKSGGRVFAKKVSDPERFGVVEFDKDNVAISIEEKPEKPRSNYAVTGLYIYDNTVLKKVANLKPSARGELEITDLNNLYLKDSQLDVAFVDGAWFDTGTFESMHSAIEFARNKELKLH
jgi:glucose-1-phosphate thymidylyltransferase